VLLVVILLLDDAVLILDDAFDALVLLLDDAVLILDDVLKAPVLFLDDALDALDEALLLVDRFSSRACITTLSREHTDARCERRMTGERRASPTPANALACPSMASTITAAPKVLDDIAGEEGGVLAGDLSIAARMYRGWSASAVHVK
jgi:hypothetical protein